MDRMPWNMRRAFDQVNAYGSDLFLHVASFLYRGVMVPDNAFSCHAKAVRGFNKGKLVKGLQFGRAFQLGRIGGHFLWVAPCTSVRMEDNASVRPMIRAHQEVCGQDVLASCGMDKGYDSTANHQYVPSWEGLKAFCLQQPGLDVSRRGEDAAETYTRLVKRRSGIEPLIGHAKQGGQLGQSRMKTDETTLAAGYGAIGGFNLRQCIRHLLGKDIKPMG
jgi:transposase, IS5 family